MKEESPANFSRINIARFARKSLLTRHIYNNSPPTRGRECKLRLEYTAWHANNVAVSPRICATEIYDAVYSPRLGIARRYLSHFVHPLYAENNKRLLLLYVLLQREREKNSV